MAEPSLASADILIVWGTILWMIAVLWRRHPWVAAAQIPLPRVGLHRHRAPTVDHMDEPLNLASPLSSHENSFRFRRRLTTSLAPILSVRGGARAIEFYLQAFNATEIFRVTDDTGSVVADCPWEVPSSGSRMNRRDT